MNFVRCALCHERFPVSTLERRSDPRLVGTPLVCQDKTACEKRLQIYLDGRRASGE